MMQVARRHVKSVKFHSMSVKYMELHNVHSAWSHLTVKEIHRSLERKGKQFHPATYPSMHPPTHTSEPFIC